MQFGDQVQTELDHQRGHDLRQTMEHLVVEKIIEPVHRRLSTEQFDGVQDEVARHSSEHQRDAQQHQQSQG
ncbi:hypothetical protein D3C78_1796670 [compost metagenome]